METIIKYISHIVINHTFEFITIFFAFIAILPEIVNRELLRQSLPFGGTSILIAVGVALDTVQQLESHLLMRHYKGFIKTGG